MTTSDAVDPVVTTITLLYFKLRYELSLHHHLTRDSMQVATDALFEAFTQTVHTFVQKMWCLSHQQWFKTLH